MVRIILGVIGGFIVWGLEWFGMERFISIFWPAFAAHQTAFQDAIEHGSPFTPDSTILLVHVVLAALASLISGLLAALIAGENKLAPLIVGVLLLAVGLMKAAMSWPYVPIWYHVLFTAVLLPMAVFGGRSKTAN